MWTDLYKAACVFEKLAQSIDIRLEVERAFPPEIYPPRMRPHDDSDTLNFESAIGAYNVYFGEIDDRFDLTIDVQLYKDTGEEKIVEAKITDNTTNKENSFETLDEAVAFYMKERKKPAKKKTEEDLLEKATFDNFDGMLSYVKHTIDSDMLGRIPDFLLTAYDSHNLSDIQIEILLKEMARNIHTPPRTLKMLGEHASNDIASVARNNPNYP